MSEFYHYDPDDGPGWAVPPAVAAALAEKRKNIERADDARKLEIAQLGRPRKPEWGDRSGGLVALMMQTLETLPKDGTIVMVFSPTEEPQHTAARWASAANEEGGVAWEGLMFADELLADVCPDGPQNVTHWYRPPTPATRAFEDGPAPVVDVEAFRREYQAHFTDHQEDTRIRGRFTNTQLGILAERGLDWRTVPYVMDVGAASPLEQPLPIIQDFRPKSNDAYVIWPNGEIGLRPWRSGE